MRTQVAGSRPHPAASHLAEPGGNLFAYFRGTPEVSSNKGVDTPPMGIWGVGEILTEGTFRRKNQSALF